MPVTSAKCGKTAVSNSQLVLSVYFWFEWWMICECEHNLPCRMKNLSCWKRTWALRPVIARVRVRFSVKPEFFQAFSHPLRLFTAAKIIFTFISWSVVQKYDSFHIFQLRIILFRYLKAVSSVDSINGENARKRPNSADSDGPQKRIKLEPNKASLILCVEFVRMVRWEKKKSLLSLIKLFALTWTRSRSVSKVTMKDGEASVTVKFDPGYSREHLTTEKGSEAKSNLTKRPSNFDPSLLLPS